jgi:Cu/Ag efflux protein CusF
MMLAQITIKGNRAAMLMTGVLVMTAAVLSMMLVMSVSAAPMTYTGKVLSIDNADKTFTVQSGSYDKLTLGWHEGVAVTRCDKPVAFDEMKIGDKVTISYSESYGKNIADNIKLEGGKC